MSEPASMSSPPQPEDRQSPLVGPPNIERPKSASDDHLKEHHVAWYPRRLSFSIAQDAIETWFISLSTQSDVGNILLKSRQIDLKWN